MALNKTRGKISYMSDVQSGESKSGYQWQRMFVVLDVNGGHGTIFKQVFQVSGDAVDDVLEFGIGDRVEISWSMYAREWNGRWFNNIDLVKIELLESRDSRPAPASNQQEIFANPQESLDPADNPADLPF